MNKNIKLYFFNQSSEKILIAVCLVIGFALRLHHALNSEYQVHPDELMQYLERAHIMVFGNGLIWQEQALAMRSLLVPSFVAVWLFMCKVLGLDNPNVYIPLVKTAFVVLSIGVPIGVYRLAKNYYGKTVALASLVFACMWYELVYWAHKPLTSVVATSLVFWYLALLYREKRDGERKFSHQKIWLMGLLLTLALTVRIQYAPLLFFFFCYTIFSLTTARARWHLVFACLTGGMLFMGVFDWFTLGYPFQALYNNIYYNVVRGMASSFGVSPFHQYFVWWEGTYYFMLWLTLIFALLRVVVKDWVVFACFLAVVIPMSVIGHKEPRFIFAATPFFLIMLSHWLVVLACWLGKSIEKWIIRKPSKRREAIVLWSVVVSVILLNAYALKQNKFIKSSRSKDYARYALKAVTSDPDVTGVWETINWRQNSGGYYYLHKAIPFYIRYGIYEDRNTDDFRPYVSHIIRHIRSKNTPIDHFFKWKTIGNNVEIWKREDKDYPQKMWNHYNLSKYDISKINKKGSLPSHFVPFPPLQYVNPTFTNE